jgi:hypothetical protein
LHNSPAIYFAHIALFICGPSSATLLEFYWKDGLKNMQWETAAYDMMHDKEAATIDQSIFDFDLWTCCLDFID